MTKRHFAAPVIAALVTGLPGLARAEITYVVCSSAELASRGVNTQVTVGIDYASGRAGTAGTLSPAQISATEVDWQQPDPTMPGVTSKNALNRVSGEMWVTTYTNGQFETTIIWQCRRAQAQF
jgi:hypothetical protein